MSRILSIILAAILVVIGGMGTYVGVYVLASSDAERFKLWMETLGTFIVIGFGAYLGALVGSLVIEDFALVEEEKDAAELEGTDEA